MTEEKEKILFYTKFVEQRKKINKDLEDISAETKVNIKYLRAIESGDFDKAEELINYCQNHSEENSSAIKEIEQYINYHVLFMTMTIIIAYKYITKEEDTIILKYK